MLAVGTRIPRWADEACREFAGRLGPRLRCDILEIEAEPRTKGRSVAQVQDAEAKRLLQRVPSGARRVALDERGRSMRSREFAQLLDSWSSEARETVFLIGGPDGLAVAVTESADLLLQISSFTLPHALARVVLLEQLYRARSILDGHPYHRE